MFKKDMSGQVRLVKLAAASALAIFAFSTAVAFAQDFMTESRIGALSAYARDNSDQADRIRYDHSGTRGREGLGASPAHPEGPGNFDD